MTGIGKLLLAINLFLSISFMAFAAAVYSTHNSWRDRAETAQQQVGQLQQQATAANEEARKAAATAEAQVEAVENRARQLEGALRNAETQRDAFETKNNRLEQELLTQTGLAESKTAEAIFRKEQADAQSAVNLKLRNEVDAKAVAVRDLQDENFSRTLEYEQLEVKYEDLLNRSADMTKLLADNNLPTEPTEVAAAASSVVEPPPPVDGVVTDARKDKTGNVRYVALSIGSDDGLREGHQLSVVRPGSRNAGRPKFLGTIEIIGVQNDTAVGRVIMKSKSGIIEVQDNVTSRI